MEIKRTFHSDPGHSWLAVPYSELLDLGIADKISTYSYIKGKTVYLEEDLDAGIYIDAVKAKGNTVKLTTKYCENTPIRNYAYYRGVV